MANFFSKPYRKNVFVQWAALFIIPAVVILWVTTYFYQAEKNKMLLSVSAQEKAVVTLGKNTIQLAFETVNGDLTYMSHYHDFRFFLNGRGVEKSFHFMEDYKMLMRLRGTYDQVRWIDKSGMEKIRIDYKNGFPTTVPKEQLQYKRDRYYFYESMNLPEGVIYMSPLDLNIEHEKIEIPYKPMIRIATVLIDERGQRRGIFIINYLGAELIKRFEHSLALSQGETMLLNEEGYWLKGSDPAEEWGFMFNRPDLTLAKRYPSVWRRIHTEEEGQFEDKYGLWTFKTIHPLSVQNTFNDKKYYWKAVTFIPSAQLYQSTKERFSFMFFMSVLALFGAAIASGGLVYLYQRKQESVEELKRLQRKTEGILLSVPDIIMQMDDAKRYTWANDEGIAFFGEDVIGNEASFYFEEEQDTYEKLSQILQGDVEAVYIESWQRRRDGEKRLLAWWCRNLNDSEGNVIGALSAARDITEEYLREEELLMQAHIFSAVQDSIIVHDLEGNFIYLNDNAWKTRGYTKEEMMRMSVKELNAPQSKSGYSEMIKAMIEKMHQKGSIKIEAEHRCKNGDLLPVEIISKLITLHEKPYVLSSVRDISRQKIAQFEIEKLSMAIEQLDDIVYITDKFGNITYVNSAYCRYLGYTREEVLGKNPRLTKSGLHEREFYAELWNTILAGNVYRNTIVNRKKNGGLYYEKKTITPLKDDKNAVIGFVSTGKDVTEETMLNQEIERVAMMDKLTGIFNRHKFEELFALESERARRFNHPLSLIMIDIDHFKSVNDTYGHDVGDEVLKGLALVVQSCIRKIDIFARWGGEEFLVLSPGTDGKNAQDFAEKLRHEVAAATFPEVGHITISLGISTFVPEDSFIDLFKRADRGLYYAKEHGRNQIEMILT